MLQGLKTGQQVFYLSLVQLLRRKRKAGCRTCPRMSAADPALTVAEMEAVGVKRLSVGGALSRLALAAFMKGVREMKEQGGFTWVRDAMPTADLKAVFGA